MTKPPEATLTLSVSNKQFQKAIDLLNTEDAVESLRRAKRQGAQAVTISLSINTYYFLKYELNKGYDTAS